MTIVGALIGSLVCGASGYLAGYMKGASKWFDEIAEQRHGAHDRSRAQREHEHLFRLPY